MHLDFRDVKIQKDVSFSTNEREFTRYNSSFSPTPAKRVMESFPPILELLLSMTILFQNENQPLGFCLITTAQRVLKPKAIGK